MSCAVFFGVLRCGIALHCLVRGVLSCKALCRLWLRLVMFCRGAPVTCPCAVLCCLWCAGRCPVVLSVVSACLSPGLAARCCFLAARCGVGVRGWLRGPCPVVGRLLRCSAPLRCVPWCCASRWCCCVLPCRLFCLAAFLCLLCPPSENHCKSCVKYLQFTREEKKYTSPNTHFGSKTRP